MKTIQKYLKNRTPHNLAVYETYKNLFETKKRKSKRKTTTQKRFQPLRVTRKSMENMRDLTGKAKINKSSFPEKIRVRN